MPSTSYLLAHKEKPMPPSPPLVLVVDDSEDQRVILGETLEFSGFNIAEASDGEEAVRKAQLLSPAAILMDLKMPRVDGFEASRRLRKNPRTRGIPVIAITAYGSPEHQRMAEEVGCDAFLQKPVPPQELLHELRRALEKVDLRAAAPPASPSAFELYPRQEGKYLVHVHLLPESLRQAVRDAQRCHRLAQESRKLAEEREGAGGREARAASRRKMANRYKLIRDVALRRLWTYYGQVCPEDFHLDNMTIEE